MGNTVLLAKRAVLGLAITQFLLQTVGLVFSIIGVLNIVGLIFHVLGIIAACLCIAGSINLKSVMLFSGATLNFFMSAVDIILFFLFLFVFRYALILVIINLVIYGISTAIFISCGVYALKLRQLVVQEKYKNIGQQMGQQLGQQMG
jgi:hypothetical protein